MITTVSLNPAIDKTILLSSMDRGGVNRITGARDDIGGKGLNVAKILNRLGIETRICGFIGSDNRQRVEELIAHDNIEEIKAAIRLQENATAALKPNEEFSIEN